MICMLTSPDPPDFVIDVPPDLVTEDPTEPPDLVTEDPPEPPDLVTDIPPDPPSISNVVTVLVLVISTSYSS